MRKWAEFILAKWWSIIAFVGLALLANILLVTIQQPPDRWLIAAKGQVDFLLFLASRQPVIVGIVAAVILILTVVGWRASIALSDDTPRSTSRSRSARVSRPLPMPSGGNVGCFLGIALFATMAAFVIHGRVYTPWAIVKSPNPSTDTNVLTSISAIGPTQAWAVGYYRDRSGYQQTLVEQWNGSTWNLDITPDLGTADNAFNSVSAVDANDAWAVGYYVNNTGHRQTLTEHWDGNSWSIMPSPDLFSRDNVLYSVSVVDENDAWAVGYYVNNAGHHQTLTEHWNSAGWTIIPSPNNSSEDNDLHSVTAISANLAWAVGSYNHDGGESMLTEKFNGIAWKNVSVPDTGDTYNSLNAVSAVDADHIWAAGTTGISSVDDGPIIEKWDGSSWTMVYQPDIGNSHWVLVGIAAVSDDNIFVVGRREGSPTEAKTIIEQWDGSHWNEMNTPNPGSTDDTLQAVTAVDATHVWAVGQSQDGSGPHNTLIVKYAP